MGKLKIETGTLGLSWYQWWGCDRRSNKYHDKKLSIRQQDSGISIGMIMGGLVNTTTQSI